MNIEKPLINSYYIDPLELAEYYNKGVKYLKVTYGESFDEITVEPTETPYECESAIKLYGGDKFLFVLNKNSYHKTINYTSAREYTESTLDIFWNNKRDKIRLKKRQPHLKHSHAIINYIGVTPDYYDRFSNMRFKLRMKYNRKTYETTVALNNLRTMSDERFMQIFGFDKSNIKIINHSTIYVNDYYPRI